MTHDPIRRAVALDHLASAAVGRHRHPRKRATDSCLVSITEGDGILTRTPDSGRTGRGGRVRVFGFGRFFLRLADGGLLMQRGP